MTKKKKENERLKIAKETLDVNKESLKISKRTYRLQGAGLVIAIFTLLVMIGVLQGIVEIRGLFVETPQTPDYAVNFTLDPNSVWLNPREDIKFTLTATNTGLKNLSIFRVRTAAYLYREEDQKLRYVPIFGYNSEYGIFNQNEFLPNQKLSTPFTVDKNVAMEMFDDKDKHVKLIFYVESVPPLDNQQLSIEIK